MNVSAQGAVREPLLQLDHLSAGYGDSVVLDDVSLALHEGDTLALLGRNGVGKTTLLATIMGQTRIHEGCLRWKGQDLRRDPPHRRAARGFGWVPQERWIFPSLTVLENLTSVAQPGPWNLERVLAMFPSLATRTANMGHQLSGGEQQMLAIGRALMLNPSVLLLDEPMEGLAPLIVQELRHAIEALIAEGGLTVVIVEQHARLALSMARRTVVLDRGRVVHDGDSDTLMRDRDLLHRLLAVA